MSGEPTTLIEALERRLRDEPQREFCRYVAPDGAATSVSVRVLLERSMGYAANFGRVAHEPRIVGVCLNSGVDQHAAFFGAMWAGHIPTMLAPPSPRMDPAKYAHSFARMIEHIRPDFLVLDDATRDKLGTLSVREFGRTELLSPAAVNEAKLSSPAHVSPDDIALLQHSSGTTGLQKGVALSHRAVLAHNASYKRRLTMTTTDTIVSWLPLYHDMGFIACFLLPAIEGIRFAQLSPFDWVLRPVSLLDQIHELRATLCWLPNFAFQFLADSVRDSQIRQGLNLSCVRAWVNSSEPVHRASMNTFLARFGAYGANERQLTASYAMAENVYAVTQSLPEQSKLVIASKRILADEHRIESAAAGPDGVAFVSNGRAIEGTEVLIAGNDELPLADGSVGEILIRGAFRFSGYFRRDDLTAAAQTDSGWYKSGDLGFVLDGEVYVTGRLKDLIIIQGRNFYPTDIEAVVAGVEGAKAGRIVSFGVEDANGGTEGLVILAELDEALTPAPDPSRLARAIRTRVAQELDCTPLDVRIVPARWLLKSTSGKLARGANRDKYLADRAAGPA